MRARYAWYVLGLLTLINFFNYVDRQVVVTMYDDLRAYFALSDTQLGALTWAFFLVHSITTVPFGWAADHWDRRKILAAAVIVWSLATLGAAYSTGFAMLLMFRSLVGIGEAAYGPVSNALLCEIFPQENKARTIAIFNGGMFAGGTAGLAAGALLGFPLAFQVVALPGVVLGIWVMTLKIPRARVEAQLTHKHFTVLQSIRMMFADSFRILRIPTLKWMAAGGILISFTAGGFITWFADFIIHYKGMTRENATYTLMFIAVSGGGIGVVVGGLVADYLRKFFVSGRTLTIALGFFLSLPFSYITVFVDSGWIFFVSAWLVMFFIPWYNGPIAAVIDDVVDDKMANTAQSAFIFLLHLLGSGPAALIVGIASDAWGLRVALCLPLVSTALSAVCFVVAGKYVGQDMENKRTAHAPQPTST